MILVILVDDMGYSDIGCYGGEIRTPNIDRLAAGGLRFTNFHTTSLCSPTRAALLTGRNHHAVNNGVITEFATAFDGYNSVIPRSAATVAQVLQQNGYSTGCFGKWHNTPATETTAIGPKDRWPTGYGFDFFYGFLAGETDQYHPDLIDDNHQIPVPRTPEEGYHLMEDMTDKAIKWIGQQKTLTPGKPFFIYFAPGATHAPHHVPKDWADKYKGKFDQGGDKLREETFARQKQLGVIPPEVTFGFMLEEGAHHWRVTPVYVLIPGVVLLSIVVTFNLFGDAVRDALVKAGEEFGLRLVGGRAELLAAEGPPSDALHDDRQLERGKRHAEVEVLEPIAGGLAIAVDQLLARPEPLRRRDTLGHRSASGWLKWIP